MKQELMERLSAITEEERRILTGDKQVQRELYTSSSEFTVDSAKMMDKGRLIDIRTHTRFIPFPEHRHNYIEIMYMCSGTTTHIINREPRLVLGQGELLFLNQFASHEILEAGKEDICINFFILPQFFDEVLPMIQRENVLSDFVVDTLRKNNNSAGYLHYKVADVLPVQNLVENLIWSLLNQPVNHRQLNQTTMGLLFMLLVNYTDKIEQSNPDQQQSATAMQTLKYIEENYQTATLTELADSLGQSVSNMSKLVKSSTGRTFQELLHEKRLNQTVHLLMKTALPITDIIFRVGYDNTSYFHRMFKDKFGMSPRQYRMSFSDRRDSEE